MVVNKEKRLLRLTVLEVQGCGAVISQVLVRTIPWGESTGYWKLDRKP